MFDSAGAIHLEIETARPAALRIRGAWPGRSVIDVAIREMVIMYRGRALAAFAWLFALAAWLPPLLLSLRRASLGLSSFPETIALGLAFSEMAIPLAGLLCGAEMIAGESEDGTLVAMAALPLSRSAIFTGKFIGRSILLVTAYLLAFGSSAAAICWFSGSRGLEDYSAVAACGLALLIASCAIGALLGAAARGRVRAFGAAVLAWVVMVFALDAFLLAAIVVIAPAPPEDPASHGYGEMAVQMEMMKLHEMDDDGQDARGRSANASGAGAAQWLMALDPVDLARISAISTSTVLYQRAAAAFAEPAGFAPLAASWLAWIGFALGLGIRRFSRADLR